jgi:chitodextrinase
VDVFSFIAGAGTIALTVTPAWDAFYRASDKRGANLDVRAELRDAAGNLVAAADPATDTSASIDVAVNSGAYYLHVSGVGSDITPYSDYASQGQYFINGSVPVGTADTTAPTPDPMQFASPPAAGGTDRISMTAVTATDDVSSVQYQFRCTVGGAGCVNSAWQSSESFTATGLAADTQYTYSVVARDLSGNQTAPSAVRSARTDAPPPPPPYVNYTAVSDTAVAGSVSGSVSGAEADDDGLVQSISERESGGKPQNRYTYLEHHWNFSIGAGDMVTVVANAWMSGPNAGESFDLEFSVDGGEFQKLFTIASTDPNNLQSANLPGAPSGSITLRVVDTLRVSGNRDANTIHMDHLYVQVGNPPTEPPDAAPSGLLAVAASSGAIDLSWSDNSSNETGFWLERSLDGSSDWVRVDLPAGTESYRNEGLQAATTYYYRVGAWNPNGQSAWATAQATTHVAPPTPAMSLSASGYKAKGVQHVVLEWAGADRVDIYRDDLPVATGVSANSFDDDIGAKGGGTYQHYVCEADTTNCSNTTTTVF